MPYILRDLVFRCAALVCLAQTGAAEAAQPFLPGGDPIVDPDDFRVTTFASGLDFPVGMVQLADGSLLVGTSASDGTAGGGFFDSIGRLVRYADAEGDGVADGPGELLFDGLPGLVTSVRREGDLVFAASAQILFARISILRTGATPSSPLTLLGTIDLSFPAPWDHFTLSLASRTTAAGSVELVFPVGSQLTQSVTGPTVAASGLFSASLPADTLYRVVIDDSGASPSVASHGVLASGLRNAFGAAFEPGGDLLFVDNGFEDPSEPSQPLMADELNRLEAAELGGPAEQFGFPTHYVEYATGNVIGAGGRLPEVSFQPIAAGESRGPAALSLAPPGFPLALREGAFVGFHGSFSAVGAGNHSPVVWIDRTSGRYFHFISAQEPAIGHPDGLLATNDSLFVADFSNVSGFQGFGTGAIFQIHSIAAPPCADDRDCDGIPDGSDKCPYWVSAQSDTDGDGRGDECECTDQNGDGRNTVSDLVAINTAIFSPAQVTPLCDGNGDGACDVSDIIAANIEIFSPTSTSTCARQPVPGP